MATSNEAEIARHPDALEPAAFEKDFLFLKPLILEHWPTIDAAALDATNGDVDRVVALVAKAADKDELVRAQLARVATGADDGIQGRIRRVVQRLEVRSQEMVKKADNRAQEAVSENLWRNLLMLLLGSLLIGFVVGYTRR